MHLSSSSWYNQAWPPTIYVLWSNLQKQHMGRKFCKFSKSTCQVNIPDLLLWGLLFSSFTCPCVCTGAGSTVSKAKQEKSVHTTMSSLSWKGNRQRWIQADVRTQITKKKRGGKLFQREFCTSCLATLWNWPCVALDGWGDFDWKSLFGIQVVDGTRLNCLLHHWTFTHWMNRRKCSTWRENQKVSKATMTPDLESHSPGIKAKQVQKPSPLTLPSD